MHHPPPTVPTMHQQWRTDSTLGPALRRGKTLAPIQTKFNRRPISQLERPRPVEMIIYERPPAVPEPSRVKRTSSKKGWLRLLSRHKSLKIFTEEDSMAAGRETRNGPENDWANFSFTMDDRATARPSEVATTTARPTKSTKAWDPPPLFQAYPQSMKHATLAAPIASADSILRGDKPRRSFGKKQDPAAGTVGLDTGTLGVETARGDDDGRKKHSRHSSTSGTQWEWTTKIYVLATSGFLMQYAGDGSFDRLPEKIMQLSKDSAAFASDAISGKHWVLHISQAANDNGAILAGRSKSMLQKLGFGGESRRSVASMLLVLDRPDEMDAWLVAVRKEIEALGGKRYRPDMAVRKNTEEMVQQVTERPSRLFLIKRDPNRFSSATTSPLSATQFGAQNVDGANRPTRVSLSPSAHRQSCVPSQSPDAPSTIGTSISVDPALPASLPGSPVFSNPSTAGGTLTTPIETCTPPSSTKAHSKSDIGRSSSYDTLTPVTKRVIRQRSFQTLSPSDYQRKSLDLRPTSHSTRPHSTYGVGHLRNTSPVAPHYSIPTFSKRFSQSGRIPSVLTPDPSTMPTVRTPSPHGDSTANEHRQSFLSEASTTHRRSREASPARGRMGPDGLATTASHPPSASDKSRGRSVDSKTFSASDGTPLPRRFSSLDYAYNQLHHYSPAPHPPPTIALPTLPLLDPLPTSTTTTTTPPIPKLRRPASMHVRSGASSRPAKLHSQSSHATLLPSTTIQSWSAESESAPPIRHCSPGSNHRRRSSRTSLMAGPPAAEPPSEPLPDLPISCLGTRGGEEVGRGLGLGLGGGCEVYERAVLRGVSVS